MSGGEGRWQTGALTPAFGPGADGGMHISGKMKGQGA